RLAVGFLGLLFLGSACGHHPVPLVIPTLGWVTADDTAACKELKDIAESRASPGYKAGEMLGAIGLAAISLNLSPPVKAAFTAENDHPSGVHARALGGV